ncbi:asparaginase domain-containing protein [Paenibacillus sp. HB172176]|uniref:asparaginase n=1 Tax=Paenibacillus sp. HB172176 TaxID=2493690 RepID=UPI00143C5587|nr:asparaginase domain-containing protein [Paenibacillus sp. HB172176]
MTKRMMIVFTGGTIGSKLAGADINVSGAGSYSLLEQYTKQPVARKDLAFDTIQPLNLLSENMTTADLVTLASAIRGVDPGAYQGIVVTHGSDTLAYTAAMMSYLFSDVKIPIVFTCSNYPLEDERSNGLRNFTSAIDFIEEAALPGVFAVYENGEGDSVVYLGTRLRQCEAFTDQFRGVGDIAYGRMEGGSFLWERDRRNPWPQELLQASETALEWEPDKLQLESGVVYIRPYPGLDYSLYNWGESGRPKVILHDLHHSGTACVAGDERNSLLIFLDRCREQGIAVYLCPIKDLSDALYDSSRRLVDAGAVFIENMSMEAALTKLMLAYGIYESHEDAKAFMMEKNVYFERLWVYDRVDSTEEE